MNCECIAVFGESASGAPGRIAGCASIFPARSVRQIACGFAEVLGPAEIAPIGAIGAKGENLFARAARRR